MFAPSPVRVKEEEEHALSLSCRRHPAGPLATFQHAHMTECRPHQIVGGGLRLYQAREFDRRSR